MKKINVLWMVLCFIILLVFNVLFFVVGGTKHGISIWISYASIHFAYIMLILTSILTKKGKSEAIFGFTMFSVTVWYFFIAFFTGLIFIFINLYDYKISLVVQLTMAGIYLVILILHMISNERLAASEKIPQPEVRPQPELQSHVQDQLKNTTSEDVPDETEPTQDRE